MRATSKDQLTTFSASPPPPPRSGRHQTLDVRTQWKPFMKQTGLAKFRPKQLCCLKTMPTLPWSTKVKVCQSLTVHLEMAKGVRFRKVPTLISLMFLLGQSILRIDYGRHSGTQLEPPVILHLMAGPSTVLLHWYASHDFPGESQQKLILQNHR